MNTHLFVIESWISHSGFSFCSLCV